MYSRLPSFILGFHGCDHSIAADLISGRRKANPSRNKYDWLGEGIYFWENNPLRALEFAKALRKREQTGKPPVRRPAVVGAVIDLGYCLNLMDAKFLQIVKEGYQILKQTSEEAGQEIPRNRPLLGGREILLRDLDCAVINTIHAFRAEQGLRSFDTVRSAFIEGAELFPGSTFREKNHIQLCVRNPECIKGLFWPVGNLENTEEPQPR